MYLKGITDILLYSHMQIHAEHNDNDDKAMKTSDTVLLEKIYTSHFIERVPKRLLKVLLWEGTGDRTELQHSDPHSYGHQRFFSVLQCCSTKGPEARGPSSLLDAGFLYRILSPTSLVSKLISKLNRASRGSLLLGGGFLYHILSPTGLQTNWLLVFTELIIVQSPTQYLWNGMLDRHQAALSCSSQVTLFQCISLWLYHGILPCPILSAKAAYAISSHNCHRNVSLPLSLEWHNWPGRRWVYNNIIGQIICIKKVYKAMIIYSVSLSSYSFGSFFTPALANGFPLESEWQQVSSSFQDS